MREMPVAGPARFRVPEPDKRTSVAKSLLSGTALLLVMAGLPALLLTVLGAPPVPTSLSLSVLTKAVSVNALLGLLQWVLWLAWLQFTVCVLVELVSALKGGGVPVHIPLSGTVQSIVRPLVVTALLLTSASTSASAAPVTVVPETGSGEVVAAQAAFDGSPAVQAAEAGQTGSAPSLGEQAKEQGAQVTYRLGDRVLDPELGSQLVGKRVYVVQAPQGHYHDNLWDIAERTLGEGREYRQIYDLNVGRTQPDGRTLELARLIQPDWYLIMPETATTVSRVEAVVEPAPESTLLEALGPQQQGQAPQTGSETPLHQQAEDVMPATLPAIGALTAASLFALLTRRRRYGVWGQPLPEAGEIERLLRISADTTRLSRLDLALRHLSQAHDQPKFYAAGVNDSAVTLFLSVASLEAPTPWQAKHDGNVWVLPADAEITASAEPATVGTGLVTLGRDDQGTDVLIDLGEAEGEVVVSGASSFSAEMVSALALELCTNPWSQRVRVTGVRLPETLHHVCGDRLEKVDSIDGVLDKSESGEVLVGRRARRQRRIILTTDTGSHGMSLAPGNTLVRPGSAERARWRISIDTSGSARVEPLGVVVEATRATEEDLAALAALMSQAVDGDLPGPQSPPPVTPAALRSAPVRIQLLGPALVSAPGEVESERLPMLTEAVACLALHPEGLHPHVLAAMIWPLGVTGDVVSTSVQRLRAWLGRDPEGTERLYEDESGRLLLSQDAVSDWDVFRHLLESAKGVEAGREQDLLKEALRLVRGPLCQVSSLERYSWLAKVRAAREAEQLVTRAALRLAELLGDTDPDGGSAAVSTALSVVELDQRLWRADLRLASRQGPGKLAARVEDLLDLAGADDLRFVDPQTAALVEDLAPGQGLGVRRRSA